MERIRTITPSRNDEAPTGFTLWELLVTLLVIGIVLGIGIPNFMSFRSNSNIASGVNNLVSALHLSRTEAVKRQMPVTLCASSNPLGGNPVCDGGGSGGYFAFTDTNDTDADGQPDGNGQLDASEEIVLRRDAPFETVALTADGDYVTYGTNGFLRTLAGLSDPMRTILFCDARGNQDSGGGDSVARVVVIAGTGRPQTLRSTEAVAAAAASTGGVCP